MRTHFRILGIAGALALLWFVNDYCQGVSSTAATWQPVLDDKDADALVHNALDIIQAEIKSTKKDKAAIRKSNKRIQVAAVMIVVYAQSSKGGIAENQLIAALALAQAAGKGAGNMKQLANALAAASAAKKKKANPISLKKYLDDEADVMQPFRLATKGGDGLSKALQSHARLKGVGGNGVEEKLRFLARMRRLTPAQLKPETRDLALLAGKIAALAQFMHEWAPTKKEGNKDPKDWQEWSVELRQSALELAAAAKKGDAKAVLNLAKKVNSACNKCHGVFKPD